MTSIAPWRRWLGVVVVLLACREPNPDFMPGAVLSASDTGVTLSGSSSSSAGSESTDPTASTSLTTSATTTTATTTTAGTTEADSSSTDATESSSGPIEMCGNGMLDPGEECDDANADDTDDCVAGCVAATCGDGFLHAGVETCDGTSFGADTCNSLGQPGGALACDAACALDTTGCVCGMSTPGSAGECPVECTGGCNAGTCTIDCGNCDALVCPAGWACAVQCTGNDACNGSSITCAPGHACDVTCSGVRACRDATITCGAGVCNVACGNGNNVCDGLTLNCGPNDSAVNCSAGDFVTTTPFAEGSSCACAANGC